MEESIYQFLKMCGFSARHYGYHYLKRAIKYYIESGLDASALGSNLYTYISKVENGKSPKTIEKNITCAIEWAYLKGDINFLEKHYMFNNNKGGRPTNNEFIAIASNRILYSIG